jgi:hypothetical protein
LSGKEATHTCKKHPSPNHTESNKKITFLQCYNKGILQTNTKKARERDKEFYLMRKGEKGRRQKKINKK